MLALKREVLASRRGARRELRLVRSDGEHVYDVTVDPLLDADGELIGLTTAGLDVTERTRHAESLQAAMRQVEMANAAKAAFLAAMSHELRTPLNAVVGYVDLMELGVPDELSAAQRQYARRIRQSARLLLQIIEDILQFARIETGHDSVERADVRLAEVVDEVTAILDPLTQAKQLELRVRVDVSRPSLRTDPRKLRQVLLNLLGNALKFTAAGRVELRVEEQDGSVRFHVIDTGPGIAESDLSRVFEPFWQSDRPFTHKPGGTGLGLTVCQRYAELLGGRIVARSEIGVGSVFTLELPVSAV